MKKESSLSRWHRGEPRVVSETTAIPAEKPAGDAARLRVHPCAEPLAALARLITGVQTRWIDCPAEPRQRLYFANHTSHLDFVALWAALPESIRARTRPVAAREYWE